MNDGFGVKLLGGHQRKTIAEIKTHLPAENRAGSGAGAIRLGRALLQHMTHQVEISLHRCVSVSAHKLNPRTLRLTIRHHPDRSGTLKSRLPKSSENTISSLGRNAGQ